MERMLNSVDEACFHWLLKATEHAIYLDTLQRHYPHAAIIMTHRNFNDVVSSFCRLLSVYNSIRFEEGDTTSQLILNARMLRHIDKMVEHIIKFRSHEDNARDKPQNAIFDVMYDDLIKQPIIIVRKIREHFGLSWSEKFQANMQLWLTTNPQGKQDYHTYNLSGFGLTAEDIASRYAVYPNLFLRPSN